MTPWVMLGAALAQAPALEDVDAWTRRARALLDGPDACVEFEGSASVKVVSFTPGGWLGPGARHEFGTTGTFSGRLDHGVWTRLDADLVQLDPAHTVTIDQLQPVVGRPPPVADEDEVQGNLSISASGRGTAIDVGAGSREAMNLVDRIIDEIDPATVVAYTLPDEAHGGVVLRQLVPLDDRPSPAELELRTTFSADGAPSALDVLFPARWTTGDKLIRVKLRNAQVHLRARQTPLGVLPGVESTSLVVGVLGYTVGFEQRLVYERARACGG